MRHLPSSNSRRCHRPLHPELDRGHGPGTPGATRFRLERGLPLPDRRTAGTRKLFGSTDSSRCGSLVAPSPLTLSSGWEARPAQGCSSRKPSRRALVGLNGEHAHAATRAGDRTAQSPNHAHLDASFGSLVSRRSDGALGAWDSATLNPPRIARPQIAATTPTTTT